MGFHTEIEPVLLKDWTIMMVVSEKTETDARDILKGKQEKKI